MSKLVLIGPTDVETKDETVEPMRLPPLRKFAVHRKSVLGTKVETEVVVGHSLEPIGTQGIAIVEYRQVGDRVLQTYPRMFNDWRDIEELETNSLKIN